MFEEFSACFACSEESLSMPGSLQRVFEPVLALAQGHERVSTPSLVRVRKVWSVGKLCVGGIGLLGVP